jgi:hypothetical protein
MNRRPPLTTVLQRTLLGILAVILLLIPSGCGSGSGTVGAVENVGTARSLWSRKRPASYRYQLRLLVFAPPSVTDPVIVEVRNHIPVSVTPVTPGQAIDEATFARYDTIGELLGVVEEAVERPAEQLDATFDTRYGYPKEVNIDYSRQMADEELAFRVTDFQSL